MPRRLRHFLLATTLLTGLRADEGMWTFDAPPLAQMKARYAFTPDREWLDRLRLATLMFGGQGTGSFVGREGLVLTNQHIAHAWQQQLSGPGHDLVKEGFLARTHAEERPLPGLVVRLLVSTQDVTAQVAQSLKEKGDKARASVLADLRRREGERTGLECETVQRFGEETWIYRYKAFRDVRLVMVPEYDVAAFGKDWDNFTWPRHDLDFALFRVYEKGRPYVPEHALAPSRRPLRLGDLTVVAGYPGRTRRWETAAQLDFRRRVTGPLTVQALERQARTLADYARRSPADAQRVSADLAEAENFLKVYREEVRALGDPSSARAWEEDLRRRIEASPRWRSETQGAWEAITQRLATEEPLARLYQLASGSHSNLVQGAFARAMEAVRLVPEGSRGRRAELESQPALDRELETRQLQAGLEETREWLGAQDPLVQALLGNRTPQAVAEEAIARTRLDDPAFLRSLWAGDPDAEADPLLRLARIVDPRFRDAETRYRNLDEEIRAEVARLARARRALLPDETYPEADFTLRLSYGAVASYPAQGTLQPPFTTFGGLFDRADAWGPEAENGAWALPARWRERRPELAPSTPLDFITSNDIIGGNSGSPVVDRRGDLVGLAFDGNLESIPGRFFFDPTVNRCIAVDIRAILEALRRVYDAPFLARELGAD